MRIFIALDIAGEIRARITEYMDRVRPYAEGARWARAEGLHVTLKFIGEVKEEKAQEIAKALATIAAEPFTVNFSGAGFFPTAKSPRVFWLGVDGGDALPRLASAIDAAAHSLGIAREEKPFSPHLTLARAGSGAGTSQVLRPVQRLLEAEAVPQFGTMTAREFWLYRSDLARGGSRYTKLQKFEIGK
jgi:2'-5' RNA ligase